jgi:hypothetical protein
VRKRRNAFRIFLDSVKERDRLADLGVDGKIILKGDFKYDGSVWIEYAWLRIGTSGMIWPKL